MRQRVRERERERVNVKDLSIELTVGCGKHGIFFYSVGLLTAGLYHQGTLSTVPPEAGPLEGSKGVLWTRASERQLPKLWIVFIHLHCIVRVLRKGIVDCMLPTCTTPLTKSMV